MEPVEVGDEAVEKGVHFGVLDGLTRYWRPDANRRWRIEGRPRRQ